MRSSEANTACEKMNSSREDYLQAIYRLSQEKGYTGNKHIAAYLKVSKASVSEMCGKLSAEQLIALEGTRISLSPEGRMRAEALLSDHRLWEVFLHHVLGLEGESVHAQADLLEHVTGGELREALNRFLRFPTESPSGKSIYKNLK